MVIWGNSDMWGPLCTPGEWGVRTALLPLKGPQSATFIRDLLSWKENRRVCISLCFGGGSLTTQGMYIYAEVPASSLNDGSLHKVRTSPSPFQASLCFPLTSLKRSSCLVASVPLWRPSRRVSKASASPLCCMPLMPAGLHPWRATREFSVWSRLSLMACLSVHYFLLDPSSTLSAFRQNFEALSNQRGRKHVFLI